VGTGTEEQSRVAVPEAIDKYPEVKTFGPTIPAYGVWARHVKGLKLINITLKLKNNDLRPAIICEDGDDLEIRSCSIPKTSGGQSIIRLEQVRGAIISRVKVNGSAAVFVRVEGNESRDIKLVGNKTPGIKKLVETSAEVKRIASSRQ
jgi:hypothetical protein